MRFKINSLRLPVTVCVLLAAGCGSNASQTNDSDMPTAEQLALFRPIRLEPVPDARSFVPGMETVLKADVKLPANFKCYIPVSKVGWDQSDGYYWTDPATAQALMATSPLTMANLKGPLIWVRRSPDVWQTPTEPFTPQLDQLVEKLKQAGLKNARTGSTRWGTHPVYSLKANRPDGSSAHIAWVGLNTSMGWTLLVDYRLPPGTKETTAAQQAIWTNLLTGSTGK